MTPSPDPHWTTEKSNFVLGACFCYGSNTKSGDIPQVQLGEWAFTRPLERETLHGCSQWLAQWRRARAKSAAGKHKSWTAPGWEDKNCPSTLETVLEFKGLLQVAAQPTPPPSSADLPCWMFGCLDVSVSLLLRAALSCRL